MCLRKVDALKLLGYNKMYMKKYCVDKKDTKIRQGSQPLACEQPLEPLSPFLWGAIPIIILIQIPMIERYKSTEW